MQRTTQYLKELLAQFDRGKGVLSTSTRLSFRANFSSLRDRCAQHNAPSAVVKIIQQLADHAYKLPTSMTMMQIHR